MILITIILIHKNGNQMPRNNDYNLFIESLEDPLQEQIIKNSFCYYH